jgi:hypothetical protein
VKTLAKELFLMGAQTMTAQAVCNECGRPARKEAFARDWCLECLGVVERELNAIEREAIKQTPAVRDEIARLQHAHKHEFRGRPHEL